MTRGRPTTIDLIGPRCAGHRLAALGLKNVDSLCVPIVYQLYEAISKEENALPEAALLLAGDFNAGKQNQFYQHFTSMSHVQPGEKNPRPPLLHTQSCILSSLPPSIWQFWP